MQKRQGNYKPGPLKAMGKEALGSPLTVRFSKSVTQQLQAMEDRAVFIREAVAEKLAKEMDEESEWSLEELNEIAKDVGW